MKNTQQLLEQLKEHELNFHHSHKISFKGLTGLYVILGQLSFDLSNLKVTLHLVLHHNSKKIRTKIDLFEVEQLHKFCIKLTEQDEQINYLELEADLIRLTELLETYREEVFEKEFAPPDRTPVTLSKKVAETTIQFLQSKNLIKQIDNLLSQSGIVGEEQNRLLLFLIACSYKTDHPLHALIQSTSGSGKSHLLNTIANCFPKEDVVSMTRITSKSLYHYKEGELVNKLILIQDFDGLDEEALFSFRELQSAGEISSSMAYKDKLGNLQSRVKRVKAHFASLSATTKTNIYFDNLSRSIVVRVDESDDQTQLIIQYQNQRLSGLVNTTREQEVKQELSNLVRMLKPERVINKYADKISLPVEAKMRRRLNTHFQYFIALITFLHQYQRKRDSQDRLITTKQDVKIAIEVFFDAIMLKVDELDPITRQFFERLKDYIKSQSKGLKTPQIQFTQREIRQSLNLSKMQVFRYLKTLLGLEYIQVKSGHSNTGYQYEITYWDDNQKLRTKIKQELLDQANKLR